MVVSLVASLTSGAISDKIGRRKPIILVATIMMCIGIALPWLLKSVIGMYGFALLAGLGYGIYSSVDQALNVDVLPDKENAGKDLGILNIANTIGQILGPIVTSAIVVATGSYSWRSRSPSCSSPWLCVHHAHQERQVIRRSLSFRRAAFALPGS